MVLKGFKEKSNRKHLNKIVSARQVDVNNSKIQSLGVIIHIDEISDFELFRTLTEHLKVHPNKLKVIAYSNKSKDDHLSWDLCFDPKDFGWNGTIKNVELQSFLDKDFDVLISYYTQDLLELKLLTAKSKAKFKIGILQTDDRLNDLIIKTKVLEFNVFKEELIKYLTILNKI